MTARAQRHARLPRGPLSRVVDVKSVPDQGLQLAIVATSLECASVAADLDLPAVASLSAHLGVTRRTGTRFQVQGNLQARITQRCVVTLDEFESSIEHSIDLMFAPVAEPTVDLREANRRGRGHPERTVAPVAVPGSDDQVDPPDPIIDDTIDLGSIVVEFLALACDPYPRKPGVEFGEVAFGELGGQKISPFAALERLKDRT